MIRNVVLVKLKAGQDPAEVAEIQEAFRTLDCPGTLSYTIGDDLGLREGTWSFAIVADFKDAGSYRAYDQDAEHNRVRARLAPMAEQIARVQFQVPLPGQRPIRRCHKQDRPFRGNSAGPGAATGNRFVRRLLPSESMMSAS